MNKGNTEVLEDLVKRWLDADMPFRTTWFRQRHDLKDQSQSGCDLALAHFGLDAEAAQGQITSSEPFGAGSVRTPSVLGALGVGSSPATWSSTPRLAASWICTKASGKAAVCVPGSSCCGRNDLAKLMAKLACKTLTRAA